MGLTAWVLISWLLQPWPTRIEVKDFDPNLTFLPHSDATGWWMVNGYGEEGSDGKRRWDVFDLKTGQRSEAVWAADIYKPSVPIPEGYRHVRRGDVGQWEIVDTRFHDGQSKVRLRLPGDTVFGANRTFSHDGTRALTFHLWPHSLLRILGNCHGPSWDALALHHLKSQALFAPWGIQIDSLIARVWNLESGENIRTFWLPPLTRLNSLRWNSGGRWLSRPETGLLKDIWFRRQGTYTQSLRFHAAKPRGIMVLDANTGNTVHIPVQQVDSEIGAFDAYVGESSLSFSLFGMISDRATGIPVSIPYELPDLDLQAPLHALPAGHQVKWQKVLSSNSPDQLPPIRTSDGLEVALIRSDNQIAVAAVSLDAGVMRVRSKPVKLPSNDVYLQPTQQPGIVLATWSQGVGWPKWVRE